MVVIFFPRLVWEHPFMSRALLFSFRSTGSCAQAQREVGRLSWQPGMVFTSQRVKGSPYQLSVVITRGLAKRD